MPLTIISSWSSFLTCSQSSPAKNSCLHIQEQNHYFFTQMLNNWFFSWWSKKVFAQDIPKRPLRKSAGPPNSRLNSNHTISTLYLPMVANYIIVPKYLLSLPEGELYFLAPWIIALVTQVAALAKEIHARALSAITESTPWNTSWPPCRMSLLLLHTWHALSW